MQVEGRKRKRKSRWGTEEGEKKANVSISETVSSSSGHQNIVTATPPAEARRGGPLRSIEVYEREDMIGEGSYGMVLKARCKMSGKAYAMKQVRMADGIPFRFICELPVCRLFYRIMKF